ncbi:hypothetical protein QTV44_004309 [Vibrio vulnificus]|nr:hypothetical protein [Vibrio vulnificus]ELP5730979.1 hypothetical protein [Vibrio vulnificus]
MKASTLAIATLVVLTGCASDPFGQLPNDHQLTNQPVAAMQIFPSNFQVAVYSGTEKDGYFVPNKMIYDDQPLSEFAVFNVEPNRLIAILDVKPATSKDKRDKFSICYQGGSVLAFEVPEVATDKTYYTAYFNYRYSSGSLSTDVYDNAEEVSKQVFADAYPNLGAIEALPVKQLKVKEGC